MSTLRRTLPLVLVALAAAVAPPTANAEELAAPERGTPVDADLGLVVWSAYDPAVEGYRLTLRTGDGRTTALPIDPSPVAFDADVGDDARGRRVVVYTRCPTARGRCDVRSFRVADGRDQAVAVAARAGRDERAPTLSRGRLAWVVRGARPRVLLHRLGSASTPLAVPGLPARRCASRVDGGPRVCGPVRGVIEELELHGRWLAQTAETEFEGRKGELRLVDVDRRSTRGLLIIGAGESGQRLIGPSIDGPHVYAYKSCFGDPSGCGRGAGTFRARLGSGAVELAESSRVLSGFSVDRGRVVRTDGAPGRSCRPGDEGEPGFPTGPCRIELQDLPTTWTPVRIRR